MNKHVEIYLHQGKNRTPMTESILMSELIKCQAMLEDIESEHDGKINKAMKSPRWVLWSYYQRQLESYDYIPF